METCGGARSAPVHFPRVLHVFLPGDVLLQRPPGLLLLRLPGAQGDAEAPQAQDVHQEAHEGQREGEDADEEPGRGSPPAPGLPASGLQQERTAADQDPDPQIHDRVHQQAVGHPEPCVTDANMDHFYAGHPVELDLKKKTSNV